MRSARRHRLIHPQSVVALLKRAARRASVELLERRQLLSAVVVNTAVDQTDMLGSPTVSLRDALAIASSATSAATITFDPTVFATAQTITLQGSSYLKLSSAQDVTITGPSAGVTVDGNGQSNVFIDQATAGNVGISNMTLTDGSANYGAGIEHIGSDTLTLTNVTVSNNTAYYDGGGIYNTGALVIDGSAITGNAVTNVTATDGAGGGIDNHGGTLTVANSTISGNTSQSLTAIGGGGINNSGTATILDSTISGNSNYANQAGGMPVNAPGGGVLSTGTLTVTNSTIAGNTGSLGGGMYVTGGVTLSDSTISGNTGTTGGGLYLTTKDTIQNSVISGNTNLAGGSSPDVATATGDSVVSKGHNLVGESNGSAGWVAGDILGTVASPVNAHLAALANNGGPTLTMLPQAGSPLIDAGTNPLIPAGITTDQRGLPRIYNTTVDIGSVETQPVVMVTAPSNQSAIVGQNQSFALGSFSQIGATAPFTVNVNWGDGSAVTTFAAGSAGTITPQSHTYAALGPDTVSVSVTDNSGTVTGSGTFTVNVGVASINVTPPSSQTAFVGISNSFTLGSFTELNATAPYAVAVNWGDGSSNTTFTTNATGAIASKTHTFAAPASDTVTVTVTDASGLVTGNATFGVMVSLGTVAVTPPATQTAATGLSKSFKLGSFTASNASSPYTVDVNWGDGSTDTTFIANSVGTLAAQSHTYAAVGPDTVIVTVTDASGLVTGNATFSVNVIAAFIAVSSPADQLATIGKSKSFSLGSFTQIGAPSPYTVDVSWGDGTSDTTFTQNASGNIASKSHTYAAVGTDAVSVTVTDASGGATDGAAFNITVGVGTTPSSTALAISSTRFQFSTSQTLTATVSPSTATGTVTFSQGGTVLGTGTVGTGGIATLTTSSFASGSSTVTATYSGDGTYAASISPGIDITVLQPPNTTTLSLQSSSTSITASQSVTLTAIVSPASSGSSNATGTVTFYDGSVILGTAPLPPGGVATLTTTTALPPGTDAITASYSGDINFSTSTAAAVNIDVIVSQSATSLSISNRSKTIAQDVTFWATITAGTVTPTTLASIFPTGTVTFSEEGTAIGTAAVGSNGIATLTTHTPLPQGIDLITASYSGGADFAASASVAEDLYVTAHALVPAVTKIVIPAAPIGGVRIRGSIRVNLTDELTNIETGPEKGVFAVRIFASANTTLDPSTDAVVASLLRNARIGEGKTIRVTVRITSFPASLATGTYHLLLQTTDAAGNIEWIDTGATVNITAPVISLSASFVSVPTNVLKKGAAVSITTTGNVNDLSTFTAVVGFSTDPAGHNIVATGTGKLKPAKFQVRPGKSAKVRVTGWQALLAGLPTASYYLTVTLTDANGNSAVAVSPQPIPS